VWSDGKSPLQLLDGRSRLDAIEIEIGPAIVGPPSVMAGKDFLAVDKVIVLDRSVDPYAFVISANIHRRHLTAEQKRDLIAKLIKATPEKSDRQIAETVKASPTTVGTVRREVEPTVQSGQLRVGKDGKARKQPARKKQAQRELEANQAHIDELESAREHDKDLAEQLRAAEIKIVGLEGKLEDLKAERDWLRERVAELEAALAGSGAAKAEKPKRGRGRPKGSKNKPKTTQAEAT
jgi:hypothetical protein